MEEHKNNGCENLPLPEGEGKSEISEAPPTTPIQPLTKKPTKIRPRTTIRKKAKNGKHGGSHQKLIFYSD